MDSQYSNGMQEKGGDSISHFRQVYDELYPKLMVHACKFVDEEVAEDIVHDVFVAYWEQHHMIVSSRLAAFLFKATQNSCLNYLKHQKVVENSRNSGNWPLIVVNITTRKLNRLFRCLKRMRS